MSQPTVLLEQGVAAGAYPGAVAYLARDYQVVFHGAVGRLGVEEPFLQAANPETLYDLASLTKIYLLAASLRVLESRRISLEAPLQRFLPGFDTRITLRHLLQHSSGLEWHIQTLCEVEADQWLPLTARVPLSSAPGTRVYYACTNAFLLGRALCVIEQTTLRAIIGQYVLEPLNLGATFEPPIENLAPTEGFVPHDEAARSWQEQTGDVVGNAGLFSSAADVAGLVRAFTSRDLELICKNPLSERAGWRGLVFQIDTGFYMGQSAPAGTLGHLGFTGPSLVWHPASRAIAVILNNRVHPNRNGPDRLPFHRALHDWFFSLPPS